MISNIKKAATVLLIAITAACNVDRAGLDFEGDVLQIPATVKFEYGVYNIATDAPYDTVTLKVFVRNVNGQDLDLPVTYEATNAVAMSIDSAGKLKVKTSASNAQIFASVTVNGVTKKDLAYVNIVAGTPADFPKTIGLKVLAGDSAKLGVSSSPALARGRSIQIIREGMNTPNLSTLGVAISSSNTNIGIITPASLIASTAPVRAIKSGKVYFHINTYAFGAGFKDSLEYTIGWPISANTSIYQRIQLNGIRILDFHPKRIVVGMGACVSWAKERETNLMVDMIFDDPDNVSSPAGNTHCSPVLRYDQNSGNVSLFTVTEPIGGDVNEAIAQSVRSRVFNKAGSFKYRTSLYGTTGEIYVCDEVNDATCRPGHP